MSSPEVEIAQQQWRAAQRRLQELRRDAPLYHLLLDQVELLIGELRRRVGRTYTLESLVRAYYGAEAWYLEVLGRGEPAPGWERHAALVTDAAFEVYAHGASDYAP
ncbi:MAG TPA: hypothetical protein VLN26_15215 [Gaiellaceae bacterium]|nr:hypothetical protein [Gaiellaceae bacterium]